MMGRPGWGWGMGPGWGYGRGWGMGPGWGYGRGWGWGMGRGCSPFLMRGCWYTLLLGILTLVGIGAVAQRLVRR